MTIIPELPPGPFPDAPEYCVTLKFVQSSLGIAQSTLSLWMSTQTARGADFPYRVQSSIRYYTTALYEAAVLRFGPPPAIPSEFRWTVNSMAAELDLLPHQVRNHLKDYRGPRVRPSSFGSRAKPYHYPDEALEHVRQRMAFLTQEGIQRALNRSRTWVGPRLNHDLAEDRIAPNGRLLKHYPPSELKRLQALEPTVPAGTWLTAGAIGRQLNRSHGWVDSHLNHDLVQVRRSPSGRLREHYPPSELKRLQALTPKIPPAGDWLTEHAIGLALDREPRKWVRKYLNQDLGEDRVSATGEIRRHFPPSELKRLRGISQWTRPTRGPHPWGPTARKGTARAVPDEALEDNLSNS
jgi:hypothetical protein